MEVCFCGHFKFYTSSSKCEINAEMHAVLEMYIGALPGSVFIS